MKLLTSSISKFVPFVSVIALTAILATLAPAERKEAKSWTGSAPAKLPFAWGWDNADFGAGTKASGTTVSANPAASVSAGKVLIAFTCSKPIGSTGATTNHTVSDSQGNTWSRMVEYTRAGGVTASMWISQPTTALSTTDTVTLTTSSSTTAKAIRVMRMSVGAGKTYSVVSASGATGFDELSSISIAGLSSGTRLYVGLAAIGATHTFSNPGYGQFFFGTAGNPLSSNVNVSYGYEITTSTGSTYDEAWPATDYDYVTLIAAIDEI